MKNKIIILFTLFFTATPLFSQENDWNNATGINHLDLNHEIKLQISDGLPITVAYLFVIGISEAFMNYGSYDTYQVRRTNSGSIGLNYHYKVFDWFSVGMGVNYQRNSYNYKLTKIDPEGNEIRRSAARNLNSILIMPSFEFQYLGTEFVKLYGKVDVGVSLFNYNENVSDSNDTGYTGAWAPALGIQATPIGVRIGKKYAGFAEFGIGLQGFLTAGFSAKF